MKGKWNLDGKGLVPIPKKYKKFIKSKQQQFVLDAATISMVAHMFTCYVAWQRNDLNGDLVMDLVKWNSIALLATVLLILRT